MGLRKKGLVQNSGAVRNNSRRLVAPVLLGATVQSLSRVQLFETPWTAARQASLSLTISRSLAKFTFIASVKPSNHLIL